METNFDKTINDKAEAAKKKILKVFPDAFDIKWDGSCFVDCSIPKFIMNSMKVNALSKVSKLWIMQGYEENNRVGKFSFGL